MSDLFFDTIACYQEMVCSKRPASQTVITGENDSVLLKGNGDDRVVIETVAIEDIYSLQPQAFRKPSKHDISDEFHKSVRLQIGGRRQATEKKKHTLIFHNLPAACLLSFD